MGAKGSIHLRFELVSDVQCLPGMNARSRTRAQEQCRSGFLDALCFANKNVVERRVRAEVFQRTYYLLVKEGRSELLPHISNPKQGTDNLRIRLSVLLTSAVETPFFRSCITILSLSSVPHSTIFLLQSSTYTSVTHPHTTHTLPSS